MQAMCKIDFGCFAMVRSICFGGPCQHSILFTKALRIVNAEYFEGKVLSRAVFPSDIFKGGKVRTFWSVDPLHLIRSPGNSKLRHFTVSTHFPLRIAIGLFLNLQSKSRAERRELKTRSWCSICRIRTNSWSPGNFIRRTLKERGMWHFIPSNCKQKQEADNLEWVLKVA